MFAHKCGIFGACPEMMVTYIVINLQNKLRRIISENFIKMGYDMAKLDSPLDFTKKYVNIFYLKTCKYIDK